MKRSQTSPSSHPGRAADTLARVLQRIDPDKRLKAYRIWTFWAEEMGAGIAARAEPAAFKAGVLSVRVSSAPWMQELQLMKDDLRARLNARLGEDLVRDIYFVSGRVGRARNAPPAPPRAPTAPAPALTELPALRDPRLAAAFERLVRAHARRVRGGDD